MAQRVEQLGVAVDDDRVEVLVGEDRVVGEDALALQPCGDLGDVQAGRQPVGRHGHPDDGTRPAQGQPQPPPQPGTRRVGHDRTQQRRPAEHEARRVHPGQRAVPDGVVALDEHDAQLVGDGPAGAGGGGTHGRLVGPVGEQQPDELVAQPFAGRGLLRLLEDVAARRRGRQLVDEEEDGLGERGQRPRFDPHLDGRRGDVVPAHPGADLVGAQQRGEVATLAPLDAPDLLEQLGAHAVLAARCPRHGDEPAHRGVGRHGHLDVVLVEEGRVVRPLLPQRCAHLGQQRREALGEHR
ncbi:hypothetical protein ACFQV8_16875 [Pseudonocardia benzenivorans]